MGREAVRVPGVAWREGRGPRSARDVLTIVLKAMGRVRGGTQSDREGDCRLPSLPWPAGCGRIRLLGRRESRAGGCQAQDTLLRRLRPGFWFRCGPVAGDGVVPRHSWVLVELAGVLVGRAVRRQGLRLACTCTV